MLVDRAGTILQDVVGAIRHVTDMLGEAVTQRDWATQQNVALVGEDPPPPWPCHRRRKTWWA